MDVSSSRIYPVTPQTAYDGCIAMPLPFFLAKRFATLPPVAEVRDQHSWGVVGDTRAIVMKDRSRTAETLTAAEGPQFFTYRLDPQTGALKQLATEVRGRFEFEPVGDGTRVTWSWSIDPTGVGRPAMPVFGWMWRGWARQAMEQLGRYLVP